MSGDSVNHPDHYGGGDNPYEAIKVIAEYGWAEGFCLGNALKYMRRYREKNGLEDLKKARFYLDWYIEYLEQPELEDDAEPHLRQISPEGERPVDHTHIWNLGEYFQDAARFLAERMAEDLHNPQEYIRTRYGQPKPFPLEDEQPET